MENIINKLQNYTYLYVGSYNINYNIKINIKYNLNYKGSCKAYNTDMTKIHNTTLGKVIVLNSLLRRWITQKNINGEKKRINVNYQ